MAITAITPLITLAYDFASDGLYYNITSTDDLTVEVTYKTTSYNSYSGDIEIPSTVTNNDTTYSVTGIGTSAFRKCTSLTSIIIPETVDTIGIYAFYNCSSLTSVNIPESVDSICNSAFCKCSSLTNLTLPVSARFTTHEKKNHNIALSIMVL